MTEIKFDELWEMIGNSATDIVNECQEFIGFDFNLKDKTFFEYERLKTNCKVKHFNDIEDRLDRHKVAACLAGAILNVKPIYRKKEITKPIKKIVILANETLAIFIALGIIKSFIRKTHNNEHNIDPIINMFLQKGFYFPECTDGDYISWLAYSFSQYNSAEENTLLLSNIFFLIERYSMEMYRQICQN